MHALRLARWWPLAAAMTVASSSAQMAESCARRAAQIQLRVTPAAPAAVAPLKARQDTRSLALADYLIAASGAAQADAARARLQDRARSSTDPMMTVLALHMPCVRTGCRNIEASQWSRLDPANLFAWLALPARSGADGRYLLDEISSHVRYARSYQQEAEVLLQDLPPTGLEVRQPWGLLNVRALASHCRAVGDVTTAARCEAVAELLWADGGATERLIALILAQQAPALLPERRAVWGPRLRELELAIRHRSPPMPAGPATREQVCEAIALPRAGERAAMSESDRARVLLQATGLSIWELRSRPRADAIGTLP